MSDPEHSRLVGELVAYRSALKILAQYLCAATSLGKTEPPPRPTFLQSALAVDAIRLQGAAAAADSPADQTAFRSGMSKAAAEIESIVEAAWGTPKT